jgi:hypothetical protein
LILDFHGYEMRRTWSGAKLRLRKGGFSTAAS